jgi:hypothetical protein
MNMAVFKYFRLGARLESAIRYNELYFSANHELNDPNDLMGVYYFEDDTELWLKLLQRPQADDAWNMSHHVDLRCPKLAAQLASLFKHVNFKSTTSIFEVIKEKENELAKVFISALWQGGDKESSFAFSQDSPDEARAKICILTLTALLSGGHNHTFYSVSFSKQALEPKMWAHYAEGFKGCALIYDDHEGKIDLQAHPNSRQWETHQLLPVAYLDSEKSIPILKSAIDGVAAKIFSLVQKNSFWEYEKESRLLITKTDDPRFLAMKGKVPEFPVQRVFHHDYRTIKGVIFGPRCNAEYKNKILSGLRHNRLHAGREKFLALNTELTSRGTVEVTDGADYLCSRIADGWSPLSDIELRSRLKTLNIDQPSK